MIGGALNSLKFQGAQRDSPSELFLPEKMPYNQCKGELLRDPEKLREALPCACVRLGVSQLELDAESTPAP